MATTTPTLPPLDPHQVSHSYQVFLGVTGMMTTLSTLAVAGRFASRKLGGGIASDDWTALAALVFAYGFMIMTALVATQGHAGYHILRYSMPQLEQYLKVGSGI